MLLQNDIALQEIVLRSLRNEGPRAAPLTQLILSEFGCMPAFEQAERLAPKHVMKHSV